MEDNTVKPVGEEPQEANKPVGEEPEEVVKPAPEVKADTGAEETAQNVTPPSREEILAASRKENKNGDERDMQTYNRSLQLGYSVGFVCLSVIMLVNIIVDDVLPIEMWVCFSAAWATMGLYYGIKTSTKKKALFLTEGIFCSATFIFFLVAWILKLCGVWLLR